MKFARRRVGGGRAAYQDHRVRVSREAILGRATRSIKPGILRTVESPEVGVGMVVLRGQKGLLGPLLRGS